MVNGGNINPYGVMPSTSVKQILEVEKSRQADSPKSIFISFDEFSSSEKLTRISDEELNSMAFSNGKTYSAFARENNGGFFRNDKDGRIVYAGIDSQKNYAEKVLVGNKGSADDWKTLEEVYGINTKELKEIRTKLKNAQMEKFIDDNGLTKDENGNWQNKEGKWTLDVSEKYFIAKMHDSSGVIKKTFTKGRWTEVKNEGLVKLTRLSDEQLELRAFSNGQTYSAFAKENKGGFYRDNEGRIIYAGIDSQKNYGEKVLVSKGNEDIWITLERAYEKDLKGLAAVREGLKNAQMEKFIDDNGLEKDEKGNWRNKEGEWTLDVSKKHFVATMSNGQVKKTFTEGTWTEVNIGEVVKPIPQNESKEGKLLAKLSDSKITDSELQEINNLLPNRNTEGSEDWFLNKLFTNLNACTKTKGYIPQGTKALAEYLIKLLPIKLPEDKSREGDFSRQKEALKLFQKIEPYKTGPEYDFDCDWANKQIFYELLSKDFPLVNIPPEDLNTDIARGFIKLSMYSQYSPKEMDSLPPNSNPKYAKWGVRVQVSNTSSELLGTHGATGCSILAVVDKKSDKQHLAHCTPVLEPVNKSMTLKSMQENVEMIVKECDIDAKFYVNQGADMDTYTAYEIYKALVENGVQDSNISFIPKNRNLVLYKGEPYIPTGTLLKQSTSHYYISEKGVKVIESLEAAFDKPRIGKYGNLLNLSEVRKLLTEEKNHGSDDNIANNLLEFLGSNIPPKDIHTIKRFIETVYRIEGRINIKEHLEKQIKTLEGRNKILGDRIKVDKEYNKEFADNFYHIILFKNLLAHLNKS